MGQRLVSDLWLGYSQPDLLHFSQAGEMLAANCPAVMLVLVSWEQLIGNLVIVPSPLIVGSI